MMIMFLTCLVAFAPAGAKPNDSQSQDPTEGWEIPDRVSARSVVKDDGKPVIQVALLLDTSGSMNGLIEQAKSELWSIVNNLGEARYKGQVPAIEVALYEYGKSNIPVSQGYIRQLSPLSTDLDGLSETLFSLTTNGGEEYCGMVIQTALNNLQWKNRKGSLRLIFIAGNETFYQGPVAFDEVLPLARKRGVLIHPIYCYNGNANDRLTWGQAARLADTELKVIDHNKVVVDPVTPYDDKLRALGNQLNETYVAYGDRSKRTASVARQSAQDSNSASVGADVNRSIAKGSPNYRNEDWDVVDAEKAGGKRVEDLAAEELPAEMQPMSKAERRAYVDQKAAERSRIQQEIRDLQSQRKAYIAGHRKDSADASLGRAVIEAVKTQIQSTGFTID